MSTGLWNDSEMTSVPIMYYQVAASAIPTLLIAVAIGIKQGAAYAEGFGLLTGWRRWTMAAITIIVTLAIVMGEFSALRAIVRGSGNDLEFQFTFAAISACLLLIAVEMLNPLASKLSPQIGRGLLLSVASLWLVMAVYVGYINSGVIPL